MLELRNDVSARVWTLRHGGPWILGRATEADIRIDTDETCSRRHAQVEQSNDVWFVSPLSVNNPTILNGQPIQSKSRLSTGDILEIGAQRFVVLSITPAVSMPFNPVTPGKTPNQAPVRPPVSMPSPHPANDAPRASMRLHAESTEEIALGGEKKLFIGRMPGPGGIELDHPTISRRHASFTRGRDGDRIEDLDSVNGTFVNGERIGRKHALKDRDRIQIGPFAFEYYAGNIRPIPIETKSLITAHGVARDVPTANGPKRILHPVDLIIGEGEFVCIMGPSGSGKSTLMNIISARSGSSGGAVTLYGSDFHANFESLKVSVSYVQQRDILHEDLTLREALMYAAELRLPTDISQEDRHNSVLEAARKVKLEERLDTPIKKLSGGQKKRASLGCEILAEPRVIFLDEVTSGLDEATDADMMKTLRELSAGGMTIIMVTHTLANIENNCSRLVFMAEGGHLIYDGSPKDAAVFFDVERLGDIFGVTKPATVPHWQEQLRRRPDRQNVVRRLQGNNLDSDGAEAPAPAKPARLIDHFWQASVLFRRNVSLALGAWQFLAMSFVQAVALGVLIGVAFSGEFNEGARANTQNMVLFLLGLIGIWIGCNYSCQQLVAELDIFKRERDIGIRPTEFVVAKFASTILFAVPQILITVTIMWLIIEEFPPGFIVQAIVAVVSCIFGCAIGLLVSAVSKSRDQASAISPLAVIPQLIFGGDLIPPPPEYGERAKELLLGMHWIGEAQRAFWASASDDEINLLSIHTGKVSSLSEDGAPFALGMLSLHILALLLIVVGVVYALYRDKRN